MSKIKFSDIQSAVAEHGWKVISEEYINLDTEMVFECNEGHRVYSPWKRIRDKFECPTCKQNQLVQLDDTILPKPVGTYRVLALDQASHTSGYAIFDNNKLVKYGKFHTDLDDEIARDSLVKSWLLSLINSWKPDFVAIEGIQYQEEGGGQKMGITVFQTLARLQGILMETCYTAKIPYEVCPTNTWRHACGVKGKSRVDRKRSMQLLVKEWYDVSVSDDESDAIGIGHYVCTKQAKMNTIENWEI